MPAVLVNGALKRAAYPEEVGVSSVKLQAFLDDMRAQNIEQHSIFVLRHGIVAAEYYRAPYTADYAHVMYSCSKSMAAIAVGFAIEEGHFGLHDKVLDFFPEWKPKVPDAKLESLEVFHLLTMTAGKDPNVMTNKMGLDWIRQYFTCPWAFAPGTDWKYVNENQHILLEIVRRTTGQTATQYLTPRLYEPLNFGRVPYWETSLTGTEAGGWGLFLRTEELAKVAQCLLDGGVWDGEQVIPADWAREMQQDHVSNNSVNNADVADQKLGYGYCLWQNPIPNSSRFDGMFGQYAVLMHDQDAVLCVTCNEIDEPKIRAVIWDHFPGAFCAEMATKPADSVALSLPPIDQPYAQPRSAETEQSIAGRTYHLHRPVLINKFMGMPMSIPLISATQMSAFPRGNIDNVRFVFAENTLQFSWTEDEDVANAITVGLDGEPRDCVATCANVVYTYKSWGFWADENTLELHIRAMESLGERILRFSFSGEGVRMQPDANPSFSDMLRGMVNIFMTPYLPVPNVTKPMLNTVAPALAFFAEPTVEGHKIDNR
jgi:CubicO group peptidase (beta-lactamase class C family)